MNWFKWADLFLLLGVPGIFSVFMAVASFTPGNSPVGLAIGWAAVACWFTVGGITAKKQWFSKK